MSNESIQFDDGAAYEEMMGVWSRLAGDVFLEWLAPQTGLSWLDVGCGSGAFTERIVQKCAPADIEGVDPSDDQLAYARARHKAGIARFSNAGAMDLPFAAGRFDAAVMALVIFFVPDPQKGVSEMRRVVKPGGTVSAYAWDVLGGGVPHEFMRDELRNMGLSTPMPPNIEASSLENLSRLWEEVGLMSVKTRTIEVRRTYADFDEFWRVSLLSPSMGQTMRTMSSDDGARLRQKLQSMIKPDDASGKITCFARANAVMGQVP